MFFISSSCTRKRKVNEAIQDLLGFGVKNIELSGGLVIYDQWEADFRLLRDSEELNILIHNYFPPPALKKDAFVLNLASDNEQLKQKSFELIKKSFKFISDFGISLYSVHGGHSVDMLPELKDMHFIVDKESKRDKFQASFNFYESLERIVAESLPDSKKLAVENLFPFSKEQNYCLMTLPEEIEKFLKYSRKYKNVGLLLDLGHLNVAGKAFNFDPAKCAERILSEYSDKIFQLHLSDNDGTFDFHKVCSSNSWQLKLVENFYEVVKHVPIVFEWHCKTNSNEQIRDGISYIKSYFGQTAFTELEDSKHLIYEN
ncbi:MAG: sugar phosphate isomerase/epimerase [Candidatus Omnitrophica bacterium]|nr:sugar phosphate isomerase/epimerase [Candidatus Omnitrophota bacterium]